MRQVSCSAPTRIDFVGGWTDVQPFCDEDEGFVVNAAFGVRARVVIRENAGAPRVGDPFVLAACKRFRVRDAEIELASDAPFGSGLGGSGAVGIALTGGLAQYTGQRMTRREIAELAHRIEVEDLCIIGGKQDQYAAAFGGFLTLTFRGVKVELEQLVLTAGRVDELAARSVVVYTGQSRVSGDIHAQVQEAYRQRHPDTLAALDTIRRVSREFRAVLQDGTLDTLGELLNENWDAQKRLHHSTTNAVVEHFFETAKRGGALGGKALGAGGGGCIYFLARRGERARLVEALKQAKGQILDADFDMAGLVVQ